MKEALYYMRLPGKEVVCTLCPHRCRIAEDRTGICRVRRNRDGTLHAEGYGRISAHNYDPIEKKPLFYFHPGSRIFSIGSFGCNFSCDFCQNVDIVNETSGGFAPPIDEIVRAAGRHDSIGIAYTYNEPTVWYEFMFDVAKQIRRFGLKNVIVTNGYINPEPLEQLLPYVDAMNIDLKSMNDDTYRKVCGGSLEPVLTSIRMAAKHCHVEIATLLIDGLNTSDSEIHLLARTLAQINPEIPLHLNRYHPAHKRTDPPTKVSTLQRAQAIARIYLNNVHLGNVPQHLLGE